MVDSNAAFTVCRHPEATAERSGDRVIVLHPDGQSVSTLNPVGGLIWELLPAAIADIRDELISRFPDQDRTVVIEDSDRFVAEMERTGLIVRDDAGR